MDQRKRQKQDPKKKSLVESLNPGEAAIVLRRILAVHSEIETEAEEVAKALLRDDNFEQIAENVCDSIQVLGYDKLNGRAGRREWGYVKREKPPAKSWSSWRTGAEDANRTWRRSSIAISRVFHGCCASCGFTRTT